MSEIMRALVKSQLKKKKREEDEEGMNATEREEARVEDAAKDKQENSKALKKDEEKEKESKVDKTEKRSVGLFENATEEILGKVKVDREKRNAKKRKKEEQMQLNFESEEEMVEFVQNNSDKFSTESE